MSDTTTAPLSLELITKTMKELAQEIGIMEPDEPKRLDFLKELSALIERRRSLKSADDQFIDERVTELVREMTTSEPGDPRRAQIVQEIMRLSDLLTQG